MQVIRTSMQKTEEEEEEARGGENGGAAEAHAIPLVSTRAPAPRRTILPRVVGHRMGNEDGDRVTGDFSPFPPSIDKKKKKTHPPLSVRPGNDGKEKEEEIDPLVPLGGEAPVVPTFIILLRC